MDDDAVDIDARGAAVIPGYVDAHSHLIWLGDRGEEYAQRAAGTTYQEIAARGGGIRATVRETAAGTVDELVEAAVPRARRMLRGGTTTIEIKSGYGLETDAELRELDAAAKLGSMADLPQVIATYLPLHTRPAGSRKDFLENVLHDGVPAAAKRAKFIDAFCEEKAFNTDDCESVFRRARDFGLKIKIHAEQLTNSGGAKLAARMSATSADHLEHTKPADHRALAKAGVVGVLLPGASLVLGGPKPPGRKLLDAGASVAIATDCNPGTCYSENMSLMVSLAVATCGLTPAEAIVAATRGGAAALALDDRGVLRAGNRCDLSILKTNRWIDVAYHLGGAEIDTVVLGGKVVTG